MATADKVFLKKNTLIFINNITVRAKIFKENFEKGTHSENLQRLKYLAEDVKFLKEEYTRFYNLTKNK
jgi:hypothetical protein